MESLLTFNLHFGIIYPVYVYLYPRDEMVCFVLIRSRLKPHKNAAILREVLVLYIECIPPVSACLIMRKNPETAKRELLCIGEMWQQGSSPNAP